MIAGVAPTKADTYGLEIEDGKVVTFEMHVRSIKPLVSRPIKNPGGGLGRRDKAEEEEKEVKAETEEKTEGSTAETAEKQETEEEKVKREEERARRAAAGQGDAEMPDAEKGEKREGEAQGTNPKKARTIPDARPEAYDILDLGGDGDCGYRALTAAAALSFPGAGPDLKEKTKKMGASLRGKSPQ